MYKKFVLVGFVSLFLLLAALPMINLLAAINALSLPENEIKLVISNPLNVTRVDEPFAAPIENLNLSKEARPESFRVTDAEGNEIPYQFDNLTLYGYDAYLVFPVTVEASSNATYYFYYSTKEGWSKPNYAAAVPMTETNTGYAFTAKNYSAIVNKANGVMENISTTHSGKLLTRFGGSSYGATGWEFGWYQSGIDDAQITILAQGPIRSVIAVESEVWYSDKKPYPGSSNWAFTTIYLLYKDRVEALTHQVYEGTSAMQMMQARVSAVQPIDWMLNGIVTLDTPPAPFQRTIDHQPCICCDDGLIFTIYPIRDNYIDYGRWADLTSANGSFGYGTIFYDSANITRIELGDGRVWWPPQDVLELNFIQLNMWPTGPAQPGLELWYHWALIPHENKNYTYTQAEAKKSYNPLVLYARATPKSEAFPWLIVGVTAATGTGIALAMSVLLMKRRSVNNPSKSP